MNQRQCIYCGTEMNHIFSYGYYHVYQCVECAAVLRHNRHCGVGSGDTMYPGKYSKKMRTPEPKRNDWGHTVNCSFKSDGPFTVTINQKM